MPLFACSACNVVENTALGDYWKAQLEGRLPKCSQCAFGAWHGQFTRETPEQAGLVLESDGFLNSRVSKSPSPEGACAPWRPTSWQRKRLRRQ